MTNNAQMDLTLQQLAEAITRLHKAVDDIKVSMRQLEGNQGRFMTTHQLHPISTNLSNIREMFMLEILRQKGLLDGVDLTAIEAQVREQLAEKSIPWGASLRSAQKNLETVKREIAGDYSDRDD